MRSASTTRWWRGLGKRVKGIEKLWSLPGAERTLQVVAHLNSTDGSWDRFWDAHPLTSAP
jgi:hypothetical protein